MGDQQVTTQTAMRTALTKAALDAVESNAPLSPLLAEVVKAVKRGAGTKKRKKMWSVERERARD